MKFQSTHKRGENWASDVVVLPLCVSDLGKSPLLKRLDRALKGNITKTFHQEKFKGKWGETKLIATHGALRTRYFWFVGCGPEKDFRCDYLRRAGGHVARLARQHQFQKVAWLPLQRKDWGKTIADDCQAITEGILLGSYEFSRYKKSKNPLHLSEVRFMEIPKGVRDLAQKIRLGCVVAESVTLARDLVNTPAKDMTPHQLGLEAKKALKGISVRLYSKKDLKRFKMGAYLAVAQGSTQPPTMVHMQYRPASRSQGTIVLVGKGVTFDSGGISLKPPTSMETMKDDMAGSAAVIGAMKAIAQIKPPVTVHGIVPATENMPSGSAIKPGDVVRAMNGKTIEILNTDAEGRLTLADALVFGQRFKPDVVIDVATLTGACVIALGEKCAGLMTPDKSLSDRLLQSAEKCGEKMWPLPLLEEYKEEIESPIADVKNNGGRWAGTITAGLFLKEFVNPKIPWAHIDIAGPSWTDKENDLGPRGGTGSMVATLVHFVTHYSQSLGSS
ncbi:MAG: leucyl aminopeptidase [Deltaproteobacteria bacterium RIFCSPLOWO2_02_FULL_50_16]|nr:MAG: leucyl aminopeptidase [Deltaproteobacteria bacterium RIFCSPHIGHO2_02_FULL_50_15]OGQ56679.1 MAG: leucyl aminopeptidase [Deltaproteobacteria bacterium RIFCSPLOWO2_02_FULL_50_16]OGQ65685.1 MAG: leucyl aminopeptidase [Deltaproteobacteria bacterium RIFCSPLOWO2_12_FULL_50_11]